MKLDKEAAERLITLLERVSCGSRTLDVSIAEILHGKWLDAMEYDRLQAGQPRIGEDYKPTRSLSSAKGLIPSDWQEWHVSQSIGECVAQLTRTTPGTFKIRVWGSGTAATPELALCIAALRTHIALQEEES